MTTYQHADIQGRKIFYREAGSKTNPTIVLLHGFPSSSHMFRDLIPQLANHFHVLAPDYLGFGYSDAPASNELDTPSITSPRRSKSCSLQPWV
jgi:pimeloyl-ACP methyl ester carboxylesterase